MSAASEYKRLAWVPSLTTTASTYAIGTYAYLKDNAGPLKSGVESIETKLVEYGTPLVEKYDIKDKAATLLAKSDELVDSVINYADANAPVTMGFVDAVLKQALLDPENVKHFHAVRAEYLSKVQTALDAVKERVMASKEKSLELFHERAAVVQKSITDALESIRTSEMPATLIGRVAEAWGSFLELDVVKSALEKAAPHVTKAVSLAKSAAESVKADKRYNMVYTKAVEVLEKVTATQIYATRVEPTIKPVLSKVTEYEKYYTPALEYIKPTIASHEITAK